MTYTESDLIIPVLKHLFLNKKQGVTTSQLIKILSSELKVSGRDLEILKGRKDTRFSQKVRNIVSHRTLQGKSLATYRAINNDGLHKITKAGEEYLLENTEKFSFILDNNFDYKQRKEIIDSDYKDLAIEEGYLAFATAKIRKRSRKLVEIAKEYFSVDGDIRCSACNFSFELFYGPKLGKGFIEIHHLRPIFLYEKDGEKHSIKNSLKNLAPLCSNCHRMIHRSGLPAEILLLKNTIDKHGFYTS